MRGYAAIGLESPKSPINVGGVLRAVGCYGAAMVAVSGERFRRVPTDVKKQWRATPVIETSDLHSVIPFDCVPVAVELLPQAVSLITYKHPERAFYIFGPEDGTLGVRTLSWCRDVIYVPTTSCMNLAATVNVVLYDRMAKSSMKYVAWLAAKETCLRCKHIRVQDDPGQARPGTILRCDKYRQLGRVSLMYCIDARSDETKCGSEARGCE